MRLIKSKIYSLAWLKPAIYISVVGGVILSSTRVLAAYIAQPRTDTKEELSLTVIQNEFKGGLSPLAPFIGKNWRADFTINETQGYPWTHDNLSIIVLIQHLTAPHPGENGKGKVLRLDLGLNSITQNGVPNPKIVRDSDSEFHSGTRGHVDNARGTLTAYLTNNVTRTSDIDRWNLEVKASHSVPEPVTMFGTATALGYGALLKRKYSERKKS
ncbi:PEP-CTERM sorting domain-containing protein [Microcoleus sp. herbarium2]|uniref:PEP-CTERM sorting domain-containing protein n=1 Tax=Microcoleus sp. herbarium2 TaxID=3055433 RepID=UPI002FD00AC2